MLVQAVNWHPLHRARILSTPELAHYVTEWPRQGDRGAIAETAGVPIGAAWLRLMPPEDPGYGYVAPDVPELSIGVLAAWRGRGVGCRRCVPRTAAARGGQCGRAGYGATISTS